MRLALIVILAALMNAARSFAPHQGVGSGPAGTALALGYLLLTAFLAGSLFQRIGLPRLTGYLFAGIVVGPEALDLVSPEMLGSLRIFNGVAVALIAFTAGAEMHLPSMRPLAQSIGWITGLAVLGTAALLAAAVYLLRPLLPFAATLPPLQAVAVALVLGVIMAAQSPAVVVALHDEMEAEGPVSRTVLGAVVLADLVVILLFAAVSSAAGAAFAGGADVLQAAARLAWEIVGSLVTGVGVGYLVTLYLRKVKGGGALFVVTVAFVVAEVGQRVHFDPLIVALAAGLLVRNATELGGRLLEEIEQASLPVYVVFFGITGAGLQLGSLATLLPAAALVAVRAAGLVAGTRLAARLAGAPEAVRRFAGYGLLAQAGLALALVTLFQRTFPQFGREGGALVLAVVAVNQIVGPVLYRLALLRSGEAGRASGLRPQASGLEPTPEA
jgi:Kef-type K+ transport system membrane component KefB